MVEGRGVQLSSGRGIVEGRGLTLSSWLCIWHLQQQFHFVQVTGNKVTEELSWPGSAMYPQAVSSLHNATSYALVIPQKTLIVQWNLFITDKLMHEVLSVVWRCPLLRGFIIIVLI